MLDNFVGRPSLAWRRKETTIILLFSIYGLLTSSKRGPRFFWIRPLNRALQRYTPWQIIAATFSLLYAIRNLDKLFGLDGWSHACTCDYAPEFNRAAWINTALDAGFASALSIRPKWLRDICSIGFFMYYLFNGDEAEGKVRRLRELSTLEFLRGTWDKTSNIYLRAITIPVRPSVHIRRQIIIQRPKYSEHLRPITAWLFFDGTEAELSQTTELILDFPGGGFVAMSPTHHEERLRAWTKRTQRPVLSVDYGKAPEYPYPFAIEEGFDLYCTLSESGGRIIGMSGAKLDVILSGDSAGGNIAVNVMFKLIEATSSDPSLSTLSFPRPVGLALTYAALNFSFGSWAWPSRPTPTPSSAALDERAEKLKHIKSSGALLSSSTILPPTAKVVIGSLEERKLRNGAAIPAVTASSLQDDWSPNKTIVHQQAHTSLFEQRQAVITALGPETFQSPFERAEISQLARTRLTMSSKAGYMHDPIITPSMMWAMCLLYLGKHPPPGVERDYHLSPLLAPSTLLAELPPILLQCGARDPLIDDTVLFGGRVRAAKRESARIRRSSSKTDLPTPPHDGTLHEEIPEDDVTVQIFPGWSHGYLQMSALMPKAKLAIDDIAVWMHSTFEHSQIGAEA
ncbi:alpha/beta-hydrolase [Fomitiporia mediterranea MF3/22]|uniref:alpha/beta-hydrolase n=1 Tax=Fomitiporia mediterranea (strain MF3/22) TaxID=694068 RepID=UPI00044085BD|nr:alpha/beta-hydrolase [Fomitiporia mediterranea MF3/22]EJD02859.1 alpha/beta-hydrolase [Fomitiporia mediterranea MF3/22]